MSPPAAITAIQLGEALTPRWLDGSGAAADREAAGFGRAVIERGAAGLFDIVLGREHRGRGGGRLIASALLGRGRDLGAMQAHLQVSAANMIAIKLHESLGFRTAYAYHDRERARA